MPKVKKGYHLSGLKKASRNPARPPPKGGEVICYGTVSGGAVENFDLLVFLV